MPSLGMEGVATGDSSRTVGAGCVLISGRTGLGGSSSLSAAGRGFLRPVLSCKRCPSCSKRSLSRESWSMVMVDGREILDVDSDDERMK